MFDVAIFGQSFVRGIVTSLDSNHLLIVVSFARRPTKHAN